MQPTADPQDDYCIVAETALAPRDNRKQQENCINAELILFSMKAALGSNF
jgi:hypothetical protein